MKQQTFTFKHFSIEQNDCAMKVGTDGVLLGAWVSPIPSMRRALDIGSGTGLISLMLAQRFQDLSITGLEIDPKAVIQSRKNIAKSQWKNRISIQHTSLQNFYTDKYDLIVSNPPFFSTQGKTANKERTIARHETTLTFRELFSHVARLLANNGTFSIIYPIDRETEVLTLAQANGLFPVKKTIVYPNSEKPAKRLLHSFSFQKNTPYNTSKLTIETKKRHEYTFEYRFLLKDFYLKF